MFGGSYFGSAYFGGDPAASTTPSDVTGTVAITQAANTVAAAGSQSFNATAAVTQSPNTLTAAGSQIFSASATVMQSGNTVAAVGSETFTASVSVTQSANTISASDAETFFATVDLTQSAQTVSASGSQSVSGTVAIIESANTVAIIGNAPTTVDAEAYDTAFSSEYAEAYDPSTGAAPAGGSKSKPAARRRHVIVYDETPTHQPEQIHYASAKDRAVSGGVAYGEVIPRPKKSVRIERSPRVHDCAASSESKAGGGCMGSALRMTDAKSESLSDAVAEAFIYWRVTDTWSVTDQKAEGSVIRAGGECRSKSRSDEWAKGKVVEGFSAEELELIGAAATYLFE